MSSAPTADSNKSPPLWMKSSTELLEQASSSKAAGIALYNENKINDAFYEFSAALKLLIMCETAVGHLSKENEALFKNLEVLCYLNVAACQLKASQANENKGERLNLHVVKNCTKALAIDPGNIKGLFRRATAYFNLKDYRKAKTDVAAVLSRDSANRAASNLMKSIDEREKLVNRSYETLVRNMFG